jgi:hypothetical protein
MWRAVVIIAGVVSGSILGVRLFLPPPPAPGEDVCGLAVLPAIFLGLPAGMVMGGLVGFILIKALHTPLLSFKALRMLVGAPCGVAIGFLLLYLWDIPAPAESGPAVAFFGFMATLGVAFGTLSAKEWAVLCGGIVGAIAMGLLGGLICSFIGASIGAFAVFLYQRAAKSPDKARALQAQSSVWDDELDR